MIYIAPTGHAATEVKVTMPNGTTQNATVKNSVTTMANGSRPPEGAVVHTNNGSYIMKNGSRVKVTETKVALPSGSTTTGYI